MKTLTATDLKVRTGDFFEALIKDGGVTITRNGRSFRLRVEGESAGPRKTLGAALAMDMAGLEKHAEWDFPKVEAAPLKTIRFDR